MNRQLKFTIFTLFSDATLDQFSLQGHSLAKYFLSSQFSVGAQPTLLTAAHQRSLKLNLISFSCESVFGTITKIPWALELHTFKTVTINSTVHLMNTSYECGTDWFQNVFILCFFFFFLIESFWFIFSAVQWWQWWAVCAIALHQLGLRFQDWVETDGLSVWSLHVFSPHVHVPPSKDMKFQLNCSL